MFFKLIVFNAIALCIIFLKVAIAIRINPQHKRMYLCCLIQTLMNTNCRAKSMLGKYSPSYHAVSTSLKDYSNPLKRLYFCAVCTKLSLAHLHSVTEERLIRPDDLFLIIHCPILLRLYEFETFYLVNCRRQRSSIWPSASISHTMHHCTTYCLLQTWRISLPTEHSLVANNHTLYVDTQFFPDSLALKPFN